MVRFKLIRDDDSEGMWISQRLNNGDFDYWMTIDAKYLPEFVGEGEARALGGNHLVTLSVVAPSEAGIAKLEDAAETHGIDLERSALKRLSDEVKVDLLVTYGAAATMFHKTGNNLRKLLKEAREESQKVEGLFRFYMDRPQNRVGATGWDIIKGELWPGGRS